MNISKRLRAIGDLIEDNSFILDVGCDHALLDIYVTTKNKNIKAIASDINKGPLENAKQNIKKYNLEDKIILKQANGLESYQKGIDTIILSGLGSTTIVDILKQKKEILKEIKKIIISSNNDYKYLRENLKTLGFIPEKELIIKDKNKYYQVIKFKKGTKKYKKYELKYGTPSKDLIYIEYLNYNKNKLQDIYKQLKLKHLITKIKLKQEIKYINRTLQKQNNT